MLDVKSINKGLLPPRMNQIQMNSIQNPAEGLMVFCTDCSQNGIGSLCIFINNIWHMLNILNCANIPGQPVASTHIATLNQITWNWYPVSGSVSFKWNNINDYNTAIDIGTVTSTTEIGLSCGTIYTRYLWASNTCGPSTVGILTQSTTECTSCGTSFTDSRDGKIYTTVLIGGQCWLAQNLNIGTRIDGTQSQTDNQVIEKYCYGDLESNCDIYGGLYQWDEVMQYLTAASVQGICPAGWHLPSDTELTILITFLGGEFVAGGKMKETGTAHWVSPNIGATNTSGFNALPGGYMNSSGIFNELTIYAYFWSASQSSSSYAWYRDLRNTYAGVERNNYYKTTSFSVRCIKD